MTVTASVVLVLTACVDLQKDATSLSAPINPVDEHNKLMAESGNAMAQGHLAQQFEAKQDYANAVYWYKKAAIQGYAGAQHNLANLYEDGNGVSQDHREAFYWYLKAAEQGVVHSQSEVGDKYYFGEGTLQNYKQAFYWYSKAAEQGDCHSQSKLSNIYRLGNGVAIDYKKSFFWMNKAAQQTGAPAQDLASAQGALGIFYSLGEGVPQSYEMAYVWFSIAAANNPTDTAVVGFRNSAAKKLSPQQIVRAQEKAANTMREIEGK